MKIKLIATVILIVAYYGGIVTADYWWSNRYKDVVGITGLVRDDLELLEAERLLQVWTLLQDGKCSEATDALYSMLEIKMDSVSHNIIDDSNSMEESIRHPKMYEKTQKNAVRLLKTYKEKVSITSTTTKAPLRGAGPP